MAAVAGGCTVPADQPRGTSPPQPVERQRAESIPAGAAKVTPETDVLPPVLHSSEYEAAVPLGSGVNTAGAEDSAFVTPDGRTLYFFFTPDVALPAQKQLLDGVTGIWVSRMEGGEWGQAQRVWLEDRDEPALDGAVSVLGEQMWFASARKGNYRGVDVWVASRVDGRWMDWRNAGKRLNADYEVGELHVTADGSAMYFHSARPGSRGEYDIWMSRKRDGEWQQPENVREVNTAGMEGWPFITQDGNELWFTRTYLGSPAIFRSRRVGEAWGVPELVMSQFAAEPSLDAAGNIYFAHHYFRDGEMVEADIYVAYRKPAR